LLRGQLNDSDTRRQQKREYQPTRFHIGKLIGFQHAFIWSSARIGGQKHVAKKSEASSKSVFTAI
jgi:hypothetical protein